MPLYKPSELRQFLEDSGIHPKKAFSQNFLIDGNIIRKIVQAAEVKKGDVVLEIGPGPGALTEELLNCGATVVAVEMDTHLAKALTRLDNGSLHVIESDIMDVDCAALLKPFLKSGARAKLIANLPYKITTPILARFAPMHTLFEEIVVMVQDEVARRFVAAPGTSDYGSFSLFLNFYSRPVYCFTVSNKSFYPVPKVQSAIVKLLLQEPPALADVEGFFKLTRSSFEQRRKMLRGSLRRLYPAEKVTAALLACGINEEARPEQLSLEQFLQLFAALSATDRN